MENKLLEFKKALESNEHEDRLDNAGMIGKSGHHSRYFESYNFYMTARMCGSLTERDLRLILLDDEDLEYFKKKYLTEEKLEEEMKEKVEEMGKKVEEIQSKYRKQTVFEQKIRTTLD